MTVINRSALLPYSANQLFALVCDVESYPAYMEGCVGACILNRDADTVVARLDIARAGIRQSFSTCNRMQAAKEITLELIEGPFERFSGRWGFLALGESACKLSLNLQFSLKSGLLGVAASKLLESVANNLVDAVGLRAKQLYG